MGKLMATTWSMNGSDQSEENKLVSTHVVFNTTKRKNPTFVACVTTPTVSESDSDCECKLSQERIVSTYNHLFDMMQG